MLTLLNSAEIISGTIPLAPGWPLQPNAYAIESCHKVIHVQTNALVVLITVLSILPVEHWRAYHKRRNIRWDKLSQIPPNEVFHRKTFMVPYV